VFARLGDAVTTGTDWYKPELNISRPRSWRVALFRAVVLFLGLVGSAVCLLALLVYVTVRYG
jgi:hypothetical protein